jgi:predicted nucleic acid-binding protein
MDQALILETTFLIDLEREARRERPGAAHALLEDHREHRVFITATIAGELAAGTSMGERDRWERFVGGYAWLPITTDVAWHFGDTYRYLRANGLLIGANDLWIAASGLAHRVPVVTRDARDYQRVPGLRVIGYGR